MFSKGKLHQDFWTNFHWQQQILKGAVSNLATAPKSWKMKALQMKQRAKKFQLFVYFYHYYYYQGAINFVTWSSGVGGYANLGGM